MAYSRFLAISALLLLSARANAFTLWLVGTDVASGWQSKTVSVDLDPNCATSTSVMPALNAAISTWNAVPTSDLVLSVGNTSHALPGPITNYLNGPSQYTGNPLVYCDTSFDADMGLSGGGSQGSGIPGSDMAPTLNCTGGSTYCPITGSIMLLNFDASDATNIDSIAAIVPALPSLVVAHELGHAIGFGHSADTNALMYYDASKRTALHLAQDDADAISYLYPRSELGGDKIFGCATVAIQGGTGSGGSGGSGGSRGSGGPRGSGGSGTNAAAEFALLLLACLAMKIAFSSRPSHTI